MTRIGWILWLMAILVAFVFGWLLGSPEVMDQLIEAAALKQATTIVLVTQ